jgi:hypothetical protein
MELSRWVGALSSDEIMFGPFPKINAPATAAAVREVAVDSGAAAVREVEVDSAAAAEQWFTI